MNKTTQLIIALLLASNLILIGFLYFGKPNKGTEMRPMKVIIEKLNFDESQKKEFAKLVELHKRDIQEIHQGIMESKNEVYKELKNEAPSLNDYLLQPVLNKISEIERAHFAHFLAIKKICNEDQKKRFNKMADELSSIFQPKRKP